MSFADGFTKGFGLIQDAKNSAREAELRQQQLDDTAAFREQQMGMEQQQLAEQIRSNREAEKLATQTQADNASLRSTQAQTAQLNAEAAVSRQKNDATTLDLQTKKFNADQRREERLLRERNAALAVGDMVDQISRVDNGEIPASALKDVISGIVDNTKGTMSNIERLTDETVLLDAAALNQEIQGGNITMGTLQRAANAFLASSNENGVGETVTSAYTNAPTWMHDKGLVIVNKEIVDIKEGTGAEGNAVLFGDVRVTVEDQQGNQYFYTAPLTESRDGENVSQGAATVGGQALELDVDELLNGYRGYIQMAAYVQQYKPTIDRMVEQQRFGDDTNSYTNTFETIRKGYETAAESTPMADSPIPGMTMEQFVLDKPALNRVARHETLYPGSKQKDSGFQYRSVMDSVMNTEAARTLRAQMNRDLSTREIEELAGYLDEDRNGNLIVSDAQGFQEFRNKLGVGGGSRGKTRKQIRDEQNARTAAGL